LHYIIDWACDTGVTWLELSGGEPLTLKEDLLHIIKYAHDKQLYVSLLSNGCLIDVTTAQRLRANGTKRVGISLYGANSKTHDDFTQTAGSFLKTIRGIKNVSNAGIETVANIVVTPKNVHELYRLPLLVDGIDCYTFGSVVPAGRGLHLKDYTFSEHGATDAIKTIQSAFSNIDHYFMISLYPYASEELERYCMRPVEEVVVSFEGQQIPCCVLPSNLLYHLGDAKAKDFSEVTFDNPVYRWLKIGHKAMCDNLMFSSTSHNLCKRCIEMLYLLSMRETQ
jgi:MoaA/NifB/PqqE/SkfB family radical SAM enzyme